MSFLDKVGLGYLWSKIESAVNTALATKVDAVSGKGLSTEDYTTAEKNKLASIAEGANKITVDSALSASSTNPVQNKVVNTAISNAVKNLATETYVNEAVAAMVDSAPETLNTLNELAAALGDDPNFATTVANQIGNLESKVGDKEVSVQIDEAIVSKANLEHDHDIATTTTIGFMSSPDKAFIEKLKTHDIAGMAGKTISDLQDALESWLSTACTAPNSIASFALDGGFISLWNEGDTTTTLTSGSRWTVELKTYASSGSYAKLELTSYGYKKVYYINYSNGVWGEIRSVAFSDEVPTLDEFNNLSSLVGDTSVSEQIEASNIVYVGPTQPTDPNIKVWINTAEEGTGIVPVLPRIANITLVESAWTGNTAPYSQVVDINTVTSATKIDLQPTVSQIVSMQNDDIALMAENIDGVVTIYSFGGKPTGDMSMQVLLTEVSYV